MVALGAPPWLRHSLRGPRPREDKGECKDLKQISHHFWVFPVSTWS